MTTKTFRAFIEDNSWEGEIWTHFIRVQGNEEFIKELEEALKFYEPYDYELNDEEVTEEHVDMLCENSLIGYMPTYNKVDAIVKNVNFKRMGYDEFDQMCYKGGLFKKDRLS